MLPGCEEVRSAGLNETEVYELWDVPQKVKKIYTEVKPGNNFFVHRHMMVNFLNSHTSLNLLNTFSRVWKTDADENMVEYFRKQQCIPV